MLGEFIIEYELEKVKNKNTRGYLKEVISSYNNDNFRAAIVGLYTVVIFDILHKVVYLKEIYKNEAATEILKDIDRMRKGDEHSPKWEDSLVKRVTEECSNNSHDPNKKYLKLFDSYSYGKFKRLKNDRNKCAHPAHDSEHLLRNYNRDEVRAHIRNMFEHVFLKDVILAVEICKIIDDDIEKYCDSFNYLTEDASENKNIEEYFYSKYISKLFEPETKLLFKHLWNRIIKSGRYKESQLAFSILLLLISKNKSLCEKYFEENIAFQNSEYMNDKMDDEYLDDDPVYLNNSFARVISLFAEYPNLFRKLPRPIQLDIKNKCSDKINYYLLAYYIDEDLETHFEAAEKVRSNEIKKISVPNYTPVQKIPEFSVLVLLKVYLQSKKILAIDVYKEFIFKYVIKGKNYSRCSDIMERLLPKIMTDFTKNDCLELLNVLNTYSQYYDLGKYSNGRHQEISYYLRGLKESLDRLLGQNFNYSQFDKLGI